MPLVRRLAEVFDFRPMLLISTLVFMIGSVIAGSAVSLDEVIVGRAITGCGSSGMTYLSVALPSSRRCCFQLVADRKPGSWAMSPSSASPLMWPEFKG